MTKLILLLIPSLFMAFSANAELPQDYQTWSAQEKQSYVWNERIVPSEWAELPELTGLGWDGILRSLKSLGSLGRSFSHTSDELPVGRAKLLHPYGTTATVEFVSNGNHTYGGVFKGAKGLARLSLAGDPARLGYTPGMALKFYIDGAPSVNIMVMQQLDGQKENKNFFQNVFTNSLPDPQSRTLKVAAFFFGLFVDNPVHLGIDHLAKTEVSGLVDENAKLPYQIFFVPTEEVQLPAVTDKDYRTQLGQIPAGSTLYQVWLSESENAESVYVGDLRTTSDFISSSYGDHNLFFQHRE